jgi:glycosyltransferase involved in cell wall biosynthesis
MQVVLALDVGGTERLVIELVKRLSSMASFSVCCIDQRGEWAQELVERGVSVTELLRQPGFHPSLAFRLARLAARGKVDVLHCHHYSPFVYGQLAAILNRRLRVVFTEHGRLSDARPSSKRKLANAVLGRLGASIYAVSYALRDHMAAEGLPRERIHVIHNGIEPGPSPGAAARREGRERLGLEETCAVLGTVARLDPVKDLDTMIRAAARVCQQRPGAKLVIVGDGPERARLAALVESLCLSQAVLFTGHRSDARALLPAFDVYLNSSVSEGVSISILEAMAAERPVVATAVGGNPEIVEDGRTGCTVAARDPAALAAAVDRLLESPERRDAFGVRGRQSVLEHFTFDRMAQAYLHAYTQSRSD